MTSMTRAGKLAGRVSLALLALFVFAIGLALVTLGGITIWVFWSSNYLGWSNFDFMELAMGLIFWGGCLIVASIIIGWIAAWGGEW